MSFGEAVIQGLAGDGGLFVPERLPPLAQHLPGWRGLPYAALAQEFLSLFATDIPSGELAGCVQRAYATFPTPTSPAPLIPLDTDKVPLYVMELFHGPTLAFKDFALQLLGQFYGRHIRISGQPVHILGATSGDTGSAAIYGVLGQPDVHSFILYPEGRIAPLQERQITTTGSPLVHPLAIHGSFDDAQAIVKEIFGDTDFVHTHALTAVNSINIARILAQCIYYLDAALKLGASETEPLEFVVPTGNFGNVLAGWMLSRMGVPGLRFCVVTNANDVVARFFQTGEYHPGKVSTSLAPSMDIQQASNFERWLWWHLEGDSIRVAALMAKLRSEGSFSLGSPEKLCGGILRTASCDDAGIERSIQHVHEETGYLADPHTACAFASVRQDVRSVVVATAHPAKFPEAIMKTTGLRPTHPILEHLKNLPVKKQILPANSQAVRQAITGVLASIKEQRRG